MKPFPHCTLHSTTSLLRNNSSPPLSPSYKNSSAIIMKRYASSISITTIMPQWRPQNQVGEELTNRTTMKHQSPGAEEKNNKTTILRLPIDAIRLHLSFFLSLELVTLVACSSLQKVQNCLPCSTNGQLSPLLFRVFGCI